MLSILHNAILQEVHIRGKKTFGFQYETKLFVSAVEEGSAAAEYLLPGDEIVQVSSDAIMMSSVLTTLSY